MIFLAVLLASLSVFAGPKVGDMVKMSIEYSDGSSTQTGTGTIEITKITDGKAHLAMEIKMKGEDTRSYEQDQNVNELGYFDDLDALKTHCKNQSGEMGKADVDGKTIDICTIEDGRNIMKNAVVPFGVYEVDSEMDGVVSHVKLLQYTFGN